MPTNLIHVSMLISPEDHAKLVAIARREEISVSAAARRIVHKELNPQTTTCTCANH